MPLSLEYVVERRKLAAPFRISGYVFEATDLLVFTLRHGEHQGRGEAAGGSAVRGRITVRNRRRSRYPGR